MKDSLGRTIDYLRVSLTDRCNFRCRYCMPEEGVAALNHCDILRFEEILAIIRVGAEMGIKRIRLTGGEPLVRKGVTSLVREIAAVPGIEDVSLTTNGVLLPQLAEGLKEAGLRRVNISLDTLDPQKFSHVTRVGQLRQTLDGIEAALRVGFEPVKINAVAVRGLNQDFFKFARMSVEKPLHMRFIEYMPVGGGENAEGVSWGPEDVVSAEEIRERINEQARKAGFGPLVPAEELRPEGGGPARYFRFEGALGTVGFISALSDHFCSECNRLRLSSDGRIMPCLFSDASYDIKPAAASGNEEAIREVLLQAIGRKPDEHHGRIGTARNMSQIGG